MKVGSLEKRIEHLEAARRKVGKAGAAHRITWHPWLETEEQARAQYESKSGRKNGAEDLVVIREIVRGAQA